MTDEYLEYLQSLSKEQLISMIYTPFKKTADFEYDGYKRFALEIAYDGTNFGGVAVNKGQRTIGSCLNLALKLSGIGKNTVFCGRTDAGVSAVNMIVSVDLKYKENKDYKYDLIINNWLPKEIRVTGYSECSENFNARFSCIQRQYRYYFLPNDLDFERMNMAVDKIRKMTNFFKLSKHSDENARYDRQLDYLNIVKEKEICYLEIGCRAFLHNMVRRIFYLIREVGTGKEFCLDSVRCAKPFPLVFYGAKFNEELKFTRNHLNSLKFLQSYEEKAILAELEKLKLNKFSK